MAGDLRNRSQADSPGTFLRKNRMEAKFKRVVFRDEWMSWRPPNLDVASKFLLRWILPAIPEKSYEFTNYALGYRFEATQRELDLIRSKQMFGQPALTLRPEDP